MNIDNLVRVGIYQQWIEYLHIASKDEHIHFADEKLEDALLIFPATFRVNGKQAKGMS